MATFAQDSFTDTNGVKLQSHTPDVGGSWVQHAANVNELEINTNRLRQDDTATDTRVYYNNGTPGSADYYVEFLLRDLSGSLSTNASFGILARLDTSALTGYFFRYNHTVGMQLYKVTAGIFTQLGSTTSQSLTVGQDYAIRLDVSGTTITATVDGVAKCGTPLSDSTHTTAGKTGVRIGLASNQTGVVDAFIAVDGTATGSPWYYFASAG